MELVCSFDQKENKKNTREQSMIQIQSWGKKKNQNQLAILCKFVVDQHCNLATVNE